MSTTTKPVFQFRENTDVILADVNLRKELHGEEFRQAVDLKMGIDIPNSRLEEFAPGLCEALYYNAAADDGQEQIDGVPEILPNLRFPALNGGSFSLGDKKTKMAGYELWIDYGLGDDISTMTFDLVRVTGLHIETKEGGTVHLTWKCQYAGDRLDIETCGKLASLERDQITIRLIPPAVPQHEQEPAEPMENPFPVQGGDKPAPTIEDLFINGGQPTFPALDEEQAEEGAPASGDDLSELSF
ncbi:hypothetical protein PSQ40_04820 [Curvibacter sp. HBC61]|uniref:Uncharacterized protein n=1 Tax=Curvibacter cyanobacteriorum TaxID=3026422 RepID=A0ABT5MV11_9BURK|nr:hypothetical protein [Curvibacter sp. HBC61]MDD0837888.1 hypothetical protein [Curvibacter sp. HBC61]